MKIKGICFDLDQTLCNSEDYIINAPQIDYSKYKHTAEYQTYLFLKPHLKIISWDDFLSTYNKARIEIKNELPNQAASHNRYLFIQRTLELFNMRFNPNLIYKATNIYWNYIIENMKLFPYVDNTLKKIKQNHIKIALITDLTADIQNMKLKKLKIEKYIDYLITSEEAGADKPNKEQFNLALEKLKLTKDEIIIIGNNPKTDIQLAKNASVDSILFDYNGYYAKKTLQNSPNYYTRNFKEIIKFLKLSTPQYSKQKLVVFDLLGVLTTEPHLVSKVLKSILPNIDNSFLRKNYEQHQISQINNKQFWKRLEIDNIEDIEQKIVNKIILRKDTLALVTKLRKNNKLAILSNVPKEWGNKISKKLDLTTYFDEIVFSGDLGIKKPDPEIYKMLIKKFTNINPSNIYFIDDNLKYLVSGQNMLAQTIWFKNEEQEPVFIPDYVVKKLEDINKIID